MTGRHFCMAVGLPQRLHTLLLELQAAAVDDELDHAIDYLDRLERDVEKVLEHFEPRRAA